MKRFSTYDLTAIIVWLLSAGYISYIYPLLSEKVALRFDQFGTPLRYGPKTDFLLIEIILSSVALSMYIILRLLPIIDPKRKVKYKDLTFQKLSAGILIFVSAIEISLAYSTLHHIYQLDRFIFTMTGLFFAFVGNLLPSIRPNYFAGIRTPWTLEDAGTWRATHRMAGRLWFSGGIFLTCMLLFFSGTMINVVFLIVIAVLAVIPVFYSYFYYKNHHFDKINIRD